MSKIIEFEAIYGNAKLCGYVYADEIDDENSFHWYDERGFETCQMPLNSASEDSDEAALYEAFTTDLMLTQFLYDFKDENKEVDRGDYLLKINM